MSETKHYKNDSKTKWIVAPQIKTPGWLYMANILDDEEITEDVKERELGKGNKVVEYCGDFYTVPTDVYQRERMKPTVKVVADQFADHVDEHMSEIRESSKQ